MAARLHGDSVRPGIKLFGVRDDCSPDRNRQLSLGEENTISRRSDGEPMVSNGGNISRGGVAFISYYWRNSRQNARQRLLLRSLLMSWRDVIARPISRSNNYR